MSAQTGAHGKPRPERKRILTEDTAGLSDTETARVLAAIVSYHPAFPVTESTVAAWAAAFRSTKINRLADAVQAVVDFYADPEITEPWIKPRDIVGRVRAVQKQRTRGITMREVDADLDPDDPQWAPVVNRRWSAIADGATVEEARRDIQPIRGVQS